MDHVKKNIAVLFLHPACNMTCNFCITEDSFNAISPYQAENLLKTLKSRGFNNIVLGGGEPFIWPGDLIALTQKAKEMGFFVQIGTNGAAVPEGFEFVPSVDRYILPIESINPDIHNSMRFYKKKHHQIIMRLLEKLKAARKSVTLSTIVTKINYQGVKDLAYFLNTLNEQQQFIHAWHLYMFLPKGRGGAFNAPALSIPESLYESIVQEVKAHEKGFRIFKRKDMYCSKTVDFFWVQNGKITTSSKEFCHAGFA